MYYKSKKRKFKSSSKSIILFLINSLCCYLYRKEYKRYISTTNLKKQQEKKLSSIIKSNINTNIGKIYDFKNIQTIEDYQNKVPITTYEYYEKYIEAIKEGNKSILTEENVILLEKTSGSTSKSKLIPYTNGLKKEFQCGIKPWIYNLYTNIPAIKWGKSYWSVTPIASEKEYSKGGIPIGFEEDSEYFGKLEKSLIDKVFVTPKDLAKEKDMDRFYFRTVHYLLQSKELTLISIWNPTLLILILEYLDQNKESILNSLSNNRKKEVRDYVYAKNYAKIWPNLAVISCWCDGNSKEQSKRIRELFPEVLIQPKGLLATEGFISFAFVGEEGCRLSYNSHFFEFISQKDNKIYLSNELKLNERYQVVITTSGGLYRYKIGDIVEVIGFCNKIPRIIFIGRGNKVSDLFGEKLNEEFIRNIISELDLEEEFFMVAPEVDKYVLYIQTDKDIPDIDSLFRENFHYDYCRKLRQLKKLKVYKLTGNPNKEYIDEAVKRGQRMGDIKKQILSLKGGFEETFTGYYIDN